MNKMTLGFAALAAMTSTAASADTFSFTFDTTSTLFGGQPQTIRGFFETLSTPVDRFGQTGLEITAISGTINGAAITGLFNIANNPYYYITSGATFLDGSGVRFNTATASNIAFFHQDNVASNIYRVNGNGTISAFGPATSTRVNAVAAVPEPATWAMMLLGFGAVGFSMRRNRRPALVQAA
ncbi:MAG: PEPxxWA-CTERM sorting domain-containing protein [Sphingomicrobium sp.]